MPLCESQPSHPLLFVNALLVFVPETHFDIPQGGRRREEEEGGLGGSWVLISAELLPKMPCRKLSFILLVDFGEFELFDNWEKAARSTVKCCYRDTRVSTS